MSIEFEQLYQHINGILRFLKIAIHLKKTLYIILFFAVGMNCCFSQTEYEKRFGVTEFDATKHERMYRVQIDDYQITELIECKNGEFKGTLTHSIWTTNRKGIRKDSITQKITIPDSIVKKLISELNSNGF